MALLLLCSAMFSAGEAAMFSLRRSQRRAMSTGNKSQQTVARLLEDPDRLLTAVLFWNLLVNLGYFTIASIVGLELAPNGRTGEAGAFAVGSLVVIIVFGEMVPKSLAVLQPRATAARLAIPLAVAVRALDPLLPAFRMATLLSRRLLWPRFQPEPYLHVRDLERAVRLSVSDTALVEQEQRVLESILLLSEIRAEELMRPRTQFLSFNPPLAHGIFAVARKPVRHFLTPLAQVARARADMTRREVLQLAERTHTAVIPVESSDAGRRLIGCVRVIDMRLSDSETIQSLRPLVEIRDDATHLAALMRLESAGESLAGVVNGRGETIGIVTLERLREPLF